MVYALNSTLLNRTRKHIKCDQSAHLLGAFEVFVQRAGLCWFVVPIFFALPTFKIAPFRRASFQLGVFWSPSLECGKNVIARKIFKFETFWSCSFQIYYLTFRTEFNFVFSCRVGEDDFIVVGRWCCSFAFSSMLLEVAPFAERAFSIAWHWKYFVNVALW